MPRIVVVGASLAGLRAAQAVRSAGHEGELLVVGDEPHLPYTRPPLSKELLAGAQEPEDCAFDRSAVEAQWRLGVAATGLDRERRVVQLADGETVPYDRLIVATGSRARTWPGAGAELGGLHVVRGLEDALALRAALARRPRVVIVGAGFVGCEVAATARKQGLDVTLVDIAPHPMVPLGPELGRRTAALHREHGVALRLGTGVAALRGTGHVDAVELADGTVLSADLVVVALGAIPNTEWLASSGLRLDRGGLACDATLTALRDPHILAAGDAAGWPHPLAQGEEGRVEHWTNAAEQGAAAGRNAVLDHAARAPYAAVPYFWTDQYDVKVQSVGFAGRAERVHVLEEDGERFVAVGVRGEHVIAAIAWSAPRRLMVYRRALGARPTLDALRAQIEADPKALGRPAVVA